MACKVTIVLEADEPKEAASLTRKILGRSPIRMNNNWGRQHYGIVDDDGVDEDMASNLDDAIPAGDKA